MAPIEGRVRLQPATANRKRRVGGIVLGAALAALTAGCSGDGHDGAGGSHDWETLKATLDSYVPETVSGYVFNLTVDGETQFTRAAGNYRVDLAVPTASATKAPSAAAILTLVDQGLLDLDEPVTPYLDDTIDWPVGKRAITMRMLLNHTSGLATSPDCLSETSTTTMQECVQEIADENILFVPGAGFAYGGGSYQVAGYVATRITGMTWNDFFDQAIATPLQMDSYHFAGDENPRVAGGGIVTADDYSHFQQMVLDGGVYQGRQVLSAELVEQMHTDQIAGRIKFFTPLARADFPGYAFGWWISSPSLHEGSEGPELSDPGLFGAVPWIDLDLRYSAVLLITATTEDGLEIWNASRPLIIHELAPPAATGS